MKIVVLVDWFSENMGYAENCLPKALAELGHDVHVITSTAQVYYNTIFYKKAYESFLGPPIVESLEKKIDGYMLHRLPFKLKNGAIEINGLCRLLYKLKPDIVQCFDIDGINTFHAAKMSLLMQYKLFTGCHIVTTVFPPAQKNAWEINKQKSFETNIVLHSLAFILVSVLHGGKIKASILISKKIFIISKTRICFAVTIDAADIAVRFFGVPPSKIRVSELGVDTTIFYPLRTDKEFNEQKEFRNINGFNEEDIICIYTGRFTEEKNPLVLAKAIELLRRKDKRYKALFIGSGQQEDEIKKVDGCFVFPFVPFYELPKFYRLSNIGIWPAEESTSILDATACGIPIIISNHIQAEGLRLYSVVYQKNDINDLIDKILFLQNTDKRKELSNKGIRVILSNNSWIEIAKKRVEEYQE